MGKYRINPRWANNYPTAVTLVPLDLQSRTGQTVSVALGSSPVRYTKPGSAKNAPLEMESKPATQEQLAYLYEVEKHPAVELDPAFFSAKTEKDKA